MVETFDTATQEKLLPWAEDTHKSDVMEMALTQSRLMACQRPDDERRQETREFLCYHARVRDKSLAGFVLRRFPPLAKLEARSGFARGGAG